MLRKRSKQFYSQTKNCMFKTDQLTIIKRDHNSTLQMVLSVHHTVYLNSIMMTKPLVEYPTLLPTTTNLFLSVCQLIPIPTLSVCLSTVSVPKLSPRVDTMQKQTSTFKHRQDQRDDRGIRNCLVRISGDATNLDDTCPKCFDGRRWVPCLC